MNPVKNTICFSKMLVLFEGAFPFASGLKGCNLTAEDEAWGEELRHRCKHAHCYIAPRFQITRP